MLLPWKPAATMPFARCKVAALVCAAALSPSLVEAAVRKRQKQDGTVEFTNGARRGAARPAATSAPVFAPALAQTRGGSGAFWFRERADGVMEFTNLHPVGSKWKVLFKTGPGKAAALRGTTDRVPAQDRTPERFSRFDEHIRDQQMLYGIPQAFARAIIKTESDFDPRVVSSVGAMGLMQLMPGTARDMGVTDAFDPRQNIMGGCRYLQILARRYCRTPLPEGTLSRGLACTPEDHVKVIAAYHAGPGAVDKYGGMPPYQTTRNYVATVLGRFERFLSQELAQEPVAVQAAPGSNP